MDGASPEFRPWFEMAFAVIEKAGFGFGNGRDQLIQAFNAHLDAVRGTIAAERLLVFDVKKEGWEPLCGFLAEAPGQEVFPRSNDREGFWDLASLVTGETCTSRIGVRTGGQLA